MSKRIYWSFLWKVLIDRAIKLDIEEIKPAELHSVSARPTAMWQTQNDKATNNLKLANQQQLQYFKI